MVGFTPRHILEFDTCNMLVRDLAYVLQYRARDKSDIEEKDRRPFEVKYFDLKSEACQKLLAIYDNHAKVELDDLVDLFGSCTVNGHDTSELKTYEMTVLDNENMSSDQKKMLEYLAKDSRLSHQLEAIIYGKPAIMASMIDDQARPSSWEISLPIFKVVWSLILAETDRQKHNMFGMYLFKAHIEVLDRVANSVKYDIVSHDLEYVDGLWNILKLEKSEIRTKVLEYLELDSDHVFEQFEHPVGEYFYKSIQNPL